MVSKPIKFSLILVPTKFGQSHQFRVFLDDIIRFKYLQIIELVRIVEANQKNLSFLYTTQLGKNAKDSCAIRLYRYTAGKYEDSVFTTPNAFFEHYFSLFVKPETRQYSLAMTRKLVPYQSTLKFRYL